jgi:hypothetical protein
MRSLVPWRQNHEGLRGDQGVYREHPEAWRGVQENEIESVDGRPGEHIPQAGVGVDLPDEAFLKAREAVVTTEEGQAAFHGDQGNGAA